MKRILFHGSKDIIERPQFGVGKRYNDYGSGFYCTEERDLAMEWAVSEDRDGYANCYELEEDGLTLLDLNSYSMLHWLAILLQNRTFDLAQPLALEAKDYLIKNFSLDYDKDLIIGYRADDSYFAFSRDFLQGTISYNQLTRAMRLGNPGIQVVIKSRKAFGRLNFLQAEKAKNSEWFHKKARRDDTARKEYFSLERNRRTRDDLYITQILDEEIKSGDPRLL